MAVFGVDFEVGRLRSVILHRPGAELKRLTPRNDDALLLDGLPWLARPQEEHDAFAALLRSREVEVLLLAELPVEALESGAGRMQGIAAAVNLKRLGRALAQKLFICARCSRLNWRVFWWREQPSPNFPSGPGWRTRWFDECDTATISSSDRCPI